MYYILSNKLFCCCCCNKQTTSHLHQNFSRNPTKRDVQIVVAKLWSFVYFFLCMEIISQQTTPPISYHCSLSSLVSSANWFESSRFHRSCWRYHDCTQINLTLSGEESCKFHTKKTHLICLSSNSWAATIHYHTFRSVILFWPIWLN